MRHAAGPAGPTTLAAALTAIADAENAAIYGYSTQGPRLATPAERAVARGYYDVHRAQLQSVVGWIVTYVGSAASVPPPAAVYSADGQAATTTPADRLADLEEAAAACYADAVALATGALQRAAALALQGAAVREAHWRGHAVPYPGLVGRLPA